MSIYFRVYKAFIPELGLSNKAAELMSKQEQIELAARGVTDIDWKKQPPLEGQLSDHTIWPGETFWIKFSKYNLITNIFKSFIEIKKLFGHNNDVMALDISPDNLLLATACRARDAKSATILIWDIHSMFRVAELPGHESTVVALKFSPDNR